MKKNKSEKEESFGKELFDFFKDIAISLIVVFLFVHFVASPVQVIGSSMYPTLQDGEYGFSNVISTSLGHLNRFDIVIVYIEEKDEYIVKRIIGMPNETVEYRDGHLYINGEYVEEEFLDEEYVNSYSEGTFMEDFGPIILGEDEYFCLGDNRPHSSDSRYYGAFTKNQIVSKGIFVIWPLKQLGVYTW